MELLTPDQIRSLGMVGVGAEIEARGNPAIPHVWDHIIRKIISALPIHALVPGYADPYNNYPTLTCLCGGWSVYEIAFDSFVTDDYRAHCRGEVAHYDVDADEII